MVQIVRVYCNTYRNVDKNDACPNYKCTSAWASSWLTESESKGSRPPPMLSSWPDTRILSQLSRTLTPSVPLSSWMTAHSLHFNRVSSLLEIVSHTLILEANHFLNDRRSWSAALTPSSFLHSLQGTSSSASETASWLHTQFKFLKSYCDQRVAMLAFRLAPPPVVVVEAGER